MSSIPSLDRLAISGHAYERARERLGIPFDGFRHWVDATKSGWYVINADFYRAHGLVVSADKFLYHCPWQPGLHLCLPVSSDAALVTVMAYEPRADQQPAAGAAVQRLETTARQLQGELGAARKRIEEMRLSATEVMPGCYLPKDAIVRAAVKALCHERGSPAPVLASAGVDSRAPRAGGWLALICRAYADDSIGLDDLRRLAALTEARPLLLAATKDDYAVARRRATAADTSSAASR